ncbi:MAG: Tartrate dehydratase beta subunit/Fumarate hydratase class I [Candidatus Alkanophagales archaeon MCA70_species_2]|nr:Tartrate dehydratase beta subunit/Fumarate hydratase class I [Candidatus Alkanophaga liquidiphilum]
MELCPPLTEEDVRKLKVGDVVYVSGEVVAVRDRTLARILEFIRAEQGLPVRLNGGVIFHCGPLVRKVGEGWEVVAAGPTTSWRMNETTTKLLEMSEIRAIIGKGGMDAAVKEAMRKHGAVYLAMTGGCGALAAEFLRAKEVHWSDLAAEALWIFHAEKLGPLLVAIDAHGNSLYERRRSR